MTARGSHQARRTPDTASGEAPRTGRAAVRAVVRGRVQGVNFRRFVAARAVELGLGGFARNLPDGAVEVVAEGDVPQLLHLVDLLHSGPAAAHVTGVSVSWSDHSGVYHGFGAR